ncbi:hypothetical protein KR018_003897, partial [Drosophila ironensis]
RMGLDETLDTLENARFTYIYTPAVLRMSRDPKTIFNQTELLSITMLFHKFVLVNGARAKFMTRTQLLNMMGFFFELDDMDIVVTIVDRIGHAIPCNDPAFFPDRHISLECFVFLFTVYFTRDLDVKMKFAFSIYDKLDRGQLNSEQIGFFVDKFFSFLDEEESQELRSDMIQMLLQKFDLDKDTFIQASEYYEQVRKQPALMEFLGPIYPQIGRMNVLATCANIMSWFEDSPNPRIMKKNTAFVAS